MSSTAILISGQLRTFAQCLPTLQWACFRKLDDPHFYVSCANDAQAGDVRDLVKLYPDNVHFEVVGQPALDEKNYAERAQFAPYAISVPVQSILRQAWHMERVYQFAMDNGAHKHETFVRCRPDLWMTDCPDFMGMTYPPLTCFAPFWARFGGQNDRFAIMGSLAARHYFTLYSNIPALMDFGCPFHPESLLLAQLNVNGVEVHHTLNAMFSTLRLPEPDPQNLGQMRQERRFPEILPHEIAEYARTRQ